MALCGATILTERPSRKIYFTWMIENVSKFSRRIRSSTFSTHDGCKHEFQVVAKFNEMFPEIHISNVTIGLQTVGSLTAPINAANKVNLLNINGDQYCCKESQWVTWKIEDGPIYVLSELFSDLPDKLTVSEVKKNISSEDDHEMIGLKGKRLIASYKNLKKIFILPKDVLIVTGKIKIFGCCPIERLVEDSKMKKKLQLQTDQVIEDFRKTYLKEIGTDAQLIVGDQVLKVHKFVLQSRSPVFRSMFEHDTVERINSAIYIPDVQFYTIKALMWYLYTGDIQELTYNELCDLYEAADKYQVSTLQRACSDLLMVSIQTDTVSRILVLAYLHNDSILKCHALHYVWRNFSKVKLTEEWEMIIQRYHCIASEVLDLISKFPCGNVPLKKNEPIF